MLFSTVSSNRYISLRYNGDQAMRELSVYTRRGRTIKLPCAASLIYRVTGTNLILERHEAQWHSEEISSPRPFIVSVRELWSKERTVTRQSHGDYIGINEPHRLPADELGCDRKNDFFLRRATSGIIKSPDYYSLMTAYTYIAPSRLEGLFIAAACRVVLCENSWLLCFELYLA